MSGWHLLVQFREAKPKGITPFHLGNKIQIPQLDTQSLAAKFLIPSEHTICSGPIVFKLFGLRVPLTLLKIIDGASLVAQWLRIRLPMQGTGVRALAREYPTCCAATRPKRHNYWACTLEPKSYNYWACVPRACPCSTTTREATTMRSPRTATKSSPRSPQLEKACAQQWRPNAAKNK